jgi:hypothetical protein
MELHSDSIFRLPTGWIKSAESWENLPEIRLFLDRLHAEPDVQSDVCLTSRFHCNFISHSWSVHFIVQTSIFCDMVFTVRQDGTCFNHEGLKVENKPDVKNWTNKDLCLPSLLPMDSSFFGSHPWPADACCNLRLFVRWGFTSLVLFSKHKRTYIFRQVCELCEFACNYRLWTLLPHHNRFLNHFSISHNLRSHK